MFARFDENPAMTLQDIKETKCYGGIIIPEISSDNLWLSYRQIYVKMYQYANFN